MNRRGFITAILATGTAPAFVRAASLMPVVKLWEPEIVTPGNGLLTPSEIARWMLRNYKEHLVFSDYQRPVISHAKTVRIRRPQRV